MTTNISRISGPVSFYYLKPKDSSGNLPLILLFGDVHFSYDNMCTDCTCEDEKNCCHAIYDDNFLKKLEKLAKPNRPIDFYIEFFDNFDKGVFFGSPLDKFMEFKFTFCYRHAVNLIKYKYCPAPGIRWHYTDIRKSQRKNNIENMFAIVQKFTEFCSFLKRSNILFDITRDEWLSFDKSTLLDKLNLETPLKIDVSKTEEMHKIIDLIGDLRHLTIDKCAEHIIDFIFESKSPSLIYKQFKKQAKTSVFAEKSSIVNMMHDSLFNNNDFKLFQFDIKKLDIKILDQLKNFDLTGDYSVIRNYLMVINAVFVDLYTILRITKKVESPPSLCIAYLGNAHITSIAHNFLSTGKYEKKVFEERDREKRCLNFSNVFDDLRTSLKNRNPSSSSSSKNHHKLLVNAIPKNQKTSPKPKSSSSSSSSINKNSTKHHYKLLVKATRKNKKISPKPKSSSSSSSSSNKNSTKYHYKLLVKATRKNRKTSPKPKS
jgi:hypothetical protein